MFVSWALIFVKDGQVPSEKKQLIAAIVARWNRLLTCVWLGSLWTTDGHLSSVQHPCWLMILGDYTTQFIRDYIDRGLYIYITKISWGLEMIEGFWTLICWHGASQVIEVPKVTMIVPILSHDSNDLDDLGGITRMLGFVDVVLCYIKCNPIKTYESRSKWLKITLVLQEFLS